MSLARSLKVHLRVLDVLGTTLRVVMLRPQTRTRFSTNYFHDTWHILVDRDGAALFGRLLWGLAFQRQPGTLLLIDAPHLVPTPFDGDPPDPILVIPDGLTRFDPDLLRALRLRLRRDPGPPTTIRWHTFGMEAGAAARDGELARTSFARRRREERARGRREQMSRTAGFVCYTAPPPVLRDHGLSIHEMHQTASGRYGGYHPLAEQDLASCYPYDGELQVIPGFADRVSAARVARRAVLGSDRPIADDPERYAVYHRQGRELDRLRAARRHAMRP